MYLSNICFTFNKNKYKLNSDYKWVINKQKDTDLDFIIEIEYNNKQLIISRIKNNNYSWEDITITDHDNSIVYFLKENIYTEKESKLQKNIDYNFKLDILYNSLNKIISDCYQNINNILEIFFILPIKDFPYFKYSTNILFDSLENNYNIDNYYIIENNNDKNIKFYKSNLQYNQFILSNVKKYDGDNSSVSIKINQNGFILNAEEFNVFKIDNIK